MTLHTKSTAFYGVALLFVAAFTNESFTASLLAALQHPTPQTIVGVASAIAGVIALYLSKPIGVNAEESQPK